MLQERRHLGFVSLQTLPLFTCKPAKCNLCHGNSFIPISLKTTFRGTRCLGALVTPRVERPSFVSWRAQDSTTTSNGDVEETRETMQSSSMDSSTEGNTLLGDSSSLTPQESPANTSSEEELEPRPYYKL